MVVQRESELVEGPRKVEVAGGGVEISWQATTHRGLVRRGNEDSYCAEVVDERGLAPRYLLAVADGVGGHKGGSIASKMALEAVRREFHAWVGGSASHFVAGAIRNANQEVFSAGHLRNEFYRMRTTVTAAVLEHDWLTIGHVGDCRLYRVRDGNAGILTRDHTIADELVRLHMISADAKPDHPSRHQLTRSVGSDPLLHVDIVKMQTRPGDMYLLCTDGLWSNMTLDDVKYLMEDGTPEQACRDIMGFALKDGAPDNITAVVFRVENVSKRISMPFSWRSLFRTRN